LVHTTRFIEVAAASFFNNHVQTYCSRETTDQLLAYMESVRESAKGLLAKGVVRWGKWVDPFPGKW
jgi:hypothetical protein